jgi:hypothetical protein
MIGTMKTTLTRRAARKDVRAAEMCMEADNLFAGKLLEFVSELRGSNDFLLAAGAMRWERKLRFMVQLHKQNWRV